MILKIRALVFYIIVSIVIDKKACFFFFLPKVVIVGNGAVGKSSLIQKYCKGIFTTEYKKTIGVDFLERRIRLDLPLSKSSWRGLLTARMVKSFPSPSSP